MRSVIFLLMSLFFLSACATRQPADDVIDSRLVGEWRVVEQNPGRFNIGARLELMPDGGYQIDDTVEEIFNYFSAGTWRIEPETRHLILVDRGTFGRAARYRDERRLVRTIADYALLSEDRLRIDLITIRSRPAADGVYMILARQGDN